MVIEVHRLNINGKINQSTSDETKKAMEWMLTHNPFDEDEEDAEECLAENWRYCFEYRVRTIDKSKRNVEEIVNMWPMFKNDYGFSLVAK